MSNNRPITMRDIKQIYKRHDEDSRTIANALGIDVGMVTKYKEYSIKEFGDDIDMAFYKESLAKRPNSKRAKLTLNDYDLSLIKDKTLCIREVSKKTGLTTYAVCKKRQELGVKTNLKLKTSNEHIQYIRDNLHVSTNELLKILPLSRATVNLYKRQIKK